MFPWLGLSHMFISEPVISKENGKYIIGLVYLFKMEGRTLKYYHVPIVQKKRLKLTEMK